MIYGISGKKQVGKDLFYKIWNGLIKLNPKELTDDDIKTLEKYVNAGCTFVSVNGGYEKHYFAKSLKSITCILFGCTLSDLEKEDFKESELPEEWLKSIKGNIRTYRDFLQYAGTEMFREMLNPDTWVLSTFSTYNRNDECYKWIITDVRFKNEKKAIEDLGGKVIRIETDRDKNDSDKHTSETMLDEESFDYTIHNDFVFENYVKSIFYIMKKEGVI